MKTGITERAAMYLPRNAVDIAAVLRSGARVLLYGAPGLGKSTLAAELADSLTHAGQTCACLGADPGSPAFGVPGSVTLADRQAGRWIPVAMEALCTLDAGRFRVPLLLAAKRMAAPHRSDVLLIDSPGVVRGVAGRELLGGLVDAAAVDTVLVLTRGDTAVPLNDELRALGCRLLVVPAATAARRPGDRVRARLRTAQWDEYLANAATRTVALDRLNLTGTLPPIDAATAWTGRQVALRRGQRTLALGEVQKLESGRLTLVVPGDIDAADTLLVRDAQRSAAGLLETAVPWKAEPIGYLPPANLMPGVESDTGPRPTGRIGALDVALINGVFGDPLLHLRLRHQSRSLLFDLGGGERLSARVAHQVSDVFITHAHLDHIAGFVWLMRSRIGAYPACRLYGPPGLARHIAGFMQGGLWDRVGEQGPRFEVLEFDGRRGHRFQLQVTRPEPQAGGELVVTDGELLRDAGFRVRATTLDHRGAQVLAYAYEPDCQINVRKDRLLARRLEPGPWLRELKQRVLSGNQTGAMVLPDGGRVEVADLAAELLLISPGKRLVYATDFGDTSENRQRLITLAHAAHTLFCESTFVEADREHAERNGHLTTRACGEIGLAAAVARLVPFHFSRRYQAEPGRVYREIQSCCSCVAVPDSVSTA